MQILMRAWSILGRNWVFWSEAPNVRFSEHKIVRNERLRQVLRRLALTPIRRGPKQVWAIGEPAVTAYQEITNAECVNVPYFFNQDALQCIQRTHVTLRPVRFLFVGKLIYRKGTDILLEAAELLAKERDDYEIYILGDGPQHCLADQVSDAARKRIHWLGFRELDQVPQIYASCDVLVFPSRYDGWGMAVLEAMAAGMPVIASSGCASAVEAIRHGDSGYLLDPTNAAAVAEAMKQFLDFRESVLRMGLHSRQIAIRYTDNSGAQAMSNLIKRI
jgi:glycosyltransferase involved in cell wall biosynthesis